MRFSDSLSVGFGLLCAMGVAQAGITASQQTAYGVSGIFSDGATTNAHGLNERIRVQSLLEGREFLYRLTKMYAGGK